MYVLPQACNYAFFNCKLFKYIYNLKWKLKKYAMPSNNKHVMLKLSTSVE